MGTEHIRHRTPSRRDFLVLAGSGAAATVLAACAGSGDGRSTRVIGPAGPSVERREARRRRAGAQVRAVALVAGPATIDLAGRRVVTSAFGGQVPGPLIRATAGDVLRVTFRNELDERTALHWHGLAVRNDVDGMVGTNPQLVRAGDRSLLEFTVPDPGTYWFHPHVGLQPDRGLYAPLIVDDPSDPGDYDEEWIVMLDDWTDGIGRSPSAIMRALTRGGGMKSMSGEDMGSMDGMSAGTSTSSRSSMAMSVGTSALLGGDAGDVRYPVYLMNGRPPADPQTFTSAPRRRVRLRVINAAADTVFRLALGGHEMKITHTDGFPVQPVDARSVLLGMGERIDALVTLGNGAFPLVALAEGKDASAFAVVRTGAGDPGPSTVRPAELDAPVSMPGGLVARSDVALASQRPDRTVQAVLGGNMMSYRWTINGRVAANARSLEVRAGERLRIELVNRSSMYHPMHLHGHTFGLVGPGRANARKDTVMVLPGERRAIDLDADNPGQWALHCHNAYHAEAGMMTALSYVR